MKRSGFVHTLEAVMASLLMLSTILVVLPGQETVRNDPSDRVHKALSELDKNNQLTTPSKTRHRLEPYIPSRFNYRVEFNEVNRTRAKLNAPEEVYLEPHQPSSLIIWIENAQNLDVNLSDRKLVENRDKAGFEEFKSVEGGWLNATGSGTLTFEYRNEESHQAPETDTEEIYVTTYFTGGEKLKEVRVVLWQ